jgi:hypothetical protein
MHERIAPHLKTRDRAVLVEDVFAGSGYTMSGLGLIRARLTGPESLERQVSVLNVRWIYISNDRTYVWVRRHATTLRKCEKSGDQYESADDQGSLHA